MGKSVQRKILSQSQDFKEFWQKKGPFRYALTSREYPPILLDLDEWIFSDDLKSLLKELMQWEQRKMKLVPAPFNPKKTNILKPDELTPWRILNFPQEWESAVCSAFTPVGYLTEEVRGIADSDELADVEQAFFDLISIQANFIGYVLMGPEPLLSPDSAFVDDYLREWVEDEG